MWSVSSPLPKSKCIPFVHAGTAIASRGSILKMPRTRMVKFASITVSSWRVIAQSLCWAHSAMIRSRSSELCKQCMCTYNSRRLSRYLVNVGAVFGNGNSLNNEEHAFHPQSLFTENSFNILITLETDITIPSILQFPITPSRLQGIGFSTHQINRATFQNPLFVPR